MQSAQWNLIWWLKNHSEEYIQSSILVVGLTNENRTSWYDPKHEKLKGDPAWNNHLHSQWLPSAGPNVDKGWHKLYKYYVAMSDCNELHELNYHTTTTLFDGVSARYNIPVVQFNALATTKCSLSTFYEFDILAVVGNNYHRHGHPNEQGHQNIATELTKILNQNKLLT